MPSVANHPFPAYLGTESYIFVSYSHQDGEVVFKELARLHELGYRIWYDEGIAPGNEWAEGIAEALEKSSCFLVFISQSAIESDNVRNEIHFALGEKKPFLAVHLAEAKLSSGLRLSTASRQAIFKWQLSDEHYHLKMVRALPSSCLGPPPQLAVRTKSEQRSNPAQAAKKKFRIFVSGPADVRAEREIASRVISRVQDRFGSRIELSAYFWENMPLRASGDFQDNIPDIATFDLVVGILWSRLGTKMPPSYVRPDGTRYSSSTEYELEQAILAHRSSGRPGVLIYIRNEAATLSLSMPGEELEKKIADQKALQHFINKWFQNEDGTFRFGYNNYRNGDDFEQSFEAHLQKLVAESLPQDN